MISTEELDYLIEEIAGSPDYAVVWSVWPWPDGGYMAGVILTDREWAEKQNLYAAKLPYSTQGSSDCDWDEFNGYKFGVNVHERTWYDAIIALHRALEII